MSLLGAVEAAEISPAAAHRPAAPPSSSRQSSTRRSQQRRLAFAAAPRRLGADPRCPAYRACCVTASLRWAAARSRAATSRRPRTGQEVRSELTTDEHFWRVVGLYLAEGCTSFGERNVGRVLWHFHPTKEQHLVDDVVAYWLRHGRQGRERRRRETSHVVTVQSRLVATWWTKVLGLGRNGYEQRLPDLIWDQPARMKWALLSGAVRGRRLVVAHQWRPERDHRVGDRQRRARRRRAAPAGRGRHHGVASHRTDGEVDQGHALDPHQRSRAGRTGDRARSRCATGPGRWPASPGRRSASRRRDTAGFEDGTAWVQDQLARAPTTTTATCIRWRSPGPTRSSPPESLAVSTAFPRM